MLRLSLRRLHTMAPPPNVADVAAHHQIIGGGGLGAKRNLTSMTNRLSKGASSQQPIARLDRLDVKSIIMLHDTADIFVAGRNKCNGFDSNQYLIGSKKANEAMLIGASDDWPDDWVAFTEELGVQITQCFLTHCHVDDMVNLPVFWEMLPRLQVHWCGSDLVWIDRFKESCIRYGRNEVANATLPMCAPGRLNLSNVLSSTTNRSSSFIQLGEVPCFYIHTPGHSPGHMMLHLPLQKLLFSGDLLYKDSIGRVDLPYGKGDEMAQSLRVIEEMSDGTVVFPGHGRITTLGRERRKNPALRRFYEIMAAGKQVPRMGTNSGPL